MPHSYYDTHLGLFTMNALLARRSHGDAFDALREFVTLLCKLQRDTDASSVDALSSGSVRSTDSTVYTRRSIDRCVAFRLTDRPAPLTKAPTHS